MRVSIISVAVLFFIGMLAGCQAIGGGKAEKNLPVVSLHQLSQCGASTPQVQWIQQQESLLSLRGRLHLPEGMLSLDFGTHSLLVVYLGDQPNPGYQVQLLKNDALQMGDSLRIEIERILPLPDMMYPQMITSPCLLLQIPTGRYQQIEVFDQYGEPVENRTP